MSFVESDSGRILNLTHVADLNPVVGGSYRLRWSNGMSETLSSTDGDAIREAIRTAKDGGPFIDGPNFSPEFIAGLEREREETKAPKRRKPGRPRKTETK